ncbi:UNVERIFIED_CONTAM: hypothetical protein Sangu_2014700 [Sesamum angustifolium]|uniref:Uncharacterized protein n=1 Tax=Sesamum angustifolium TaxID=2727405 RepID=A0AAW2LH40_9LAMI
MSSSSSLSCRAVEQELELFRSQRADEADGETKKQWQNGAEHKPTVTRERRCYGFE